MAKPRSSSRRRKAPAAPAAPLTDFERFQRCYRYWFCLWLGTKELLERQEPRAWARLCVKLKKHRLISTAVVDEKRGRETDSLHGLTRSQPSDAMLRHVENFSADDKLVSLRGKTRSRPSPFWMLSYYEKAMAILKNKAPGERRSQEGSDSEVALQFVARKSGYSPETCRKAIKQARREIRKLVPPRNRAPHHRASR